MSELEGGVVFGAGNKVLSGNLASEVAVLAASLGVTTTSTTHAYDPDAFLAAVRSAHDQLLEVRATLQKQNEEQKAKHVGLTRRERDVEFREKRLKAHEQLHVLKRSWLPWR